MDTQLILYKLQKYQNKLNQNILDQFGKNTIYKQKIAYYLKVLEGGNINPVKKEILDKFKNICINTCYNTNNLNKFTSIDAETYIKFLKKYMYDFNIGEIPSERKQLINSKLNEFLEYLQTKIEPPDDNELYIKLIITKTTRYLKLINRMPVKPNLSRQNAIKRRQGRRRQRPT